MNAAGLSAPPIDIGIPEAQRQQIAAGLGRLLADSYVLYGKTHGFHWNVTGPMFNTLHLMFMEQYTELWTALDAIAERIGRETITLPLFPSMENTDIDRVIQAVHAVLQESGA